MNQNNNTQNIWKKGDKYIFKTTKIVFFIDTNKTLVKVIH